MKRLLPPLVRAAGALALLAALPAMQAHAQTTSAASTLVAQPIPDRTVTYGTADAGVAKPIIWGMDAGGWTTPLIWTTGINYVGAANLTVTRMPIFATDTLKNNALTQHQKDQINDRLNMVAPVGHPMQIILSPGLGEISWYSRDATGYARYALLTELTKNYIESFGHTVVTISGYNEPDPSYANVTKQNFYDFIAACKARPALSKLRFSGCNTLNPDFALDWYNYVKPAGLSEGNTHQLAGTFDNYANFYQTVRANGDYGTSDEVHDIMEGMVGAQYGMQAGIYWGYANVARGEFSKACNGVRLGYAEHRPNWTAAAVYRQTTGQVQAFCGGSERQAVTTTYSYVAKDRDVYYEGYGPMREYSLVMPGGSGYQASDQPYAERVINVTWGEDIQPALNGRYVLVNRKSGKVLEIPGGSTTNNVALQQNTYSGATYQQWNVTPISSRTGGDFSYFTITSRATKRSVSLQNYSEVDGGSFIASDSANAANQHFYVQYVGDGYFTIRNRHVSKYLDVQGASTASGAAIVQMASNSGTDQQWRLIPVGGAVEFVAPSAPTSVVATANAKSVQLSWTASPDTDVAGYTIVRAESASGPFNTIARYVTGTSFVDNTAVLTGTYYYKLRAVDKSLNRSVYSSQVMATTTGAKDLVVRLPFDNSKLDASINGNHCATYGGTSFTTGKVGYGALVLNGTNSFVQLPATVANQQEMTVAAWVYWNGGNAWQRIFDFGNDQTQYLFLTPNNGSGQMHFAIHNGSSEQSLDAPAMATGQWVHVALTLNATAASLYVNGQLAVTSNGATVRPLDFKPVLNYLGRSQFNDALFNGRLDEVRLYNYALAPLEVATLANPTAYYQLANHGTGLVLDGLGYTTYGATCGQWGANTTSTNSFWALRETNGGYYQLQNKGTGLYLDGYGRTTNGDACSQYGNSGSSNQQWAVEQVDASYFRLRNRATSLYLDGMGRTANASDVGQYSGNTSANQQWSFGNPATARTAAPLAATSAADDKAVRLYPNPVGDVLHLEVGGAGSTGRVRILNALGQAARELPLSGPTMSLPVTDLAGGFYILEITTPGTTTQVKFLKQ